MTSCHAWISARPSTPPTIIGPANVVDLSAIASVGSAVSLMVFLLVDLTGWRRRADTHSNPVSRPRFLR